MTAWNARLPCTYEQTLLLCPRPRWQSHGADARTTAAQRLFWTNATSGAQLNSTTVLVNGDGHEAARCEFNPTSRARQPVPGTCPGERSFRTCTAAERWGHCHGAACMWFILL